MALSILDGNQSATTLSTILTSGQHIPAHTVVSLGTQAITDMRSAVSGSVVSISNFPATQPVSIASVTIGSLPAISGTVTANTYNGLNWIYVAGSFDYSNGVDTSITLYLNTYFKRVSEYRWESFSYIANSDKCFAYITQEQDDDGGYWRLYVDYLSIGGPIGIVSGILAQIELTPPNIYSKFPPQAGWGIRTDLGFTGSVSVNYVQPETYQSQVTNSVTIGSLPAISGTVTIGSALPAGTNRIGVVTIGGGTVTIGAGTAQIGSVTASISGTVPVSISSVTVGNSVTIGSLPAISGTVTIGAVSTTVTIAHHQGTSVTTSNFTSTTASTTLASANASREVLTIFNEGAGNLHICAGATCTTIAYQVRLSAGDYYEVPLNQTSLTHSAVFATAGTARVTQIS